MRKHYRIMVLLAIALMAALVFGACQSALAPSAPKAEAPKTEAPKAEAPKAEAPKAEAPKAEAPKAEAPKAEAKPVAKEPYKVGLISILTGPLAGVGLIFKNAVQLEVDRVNAAGGVDGRQIDLIIEDDGADPTRASTALTKLIRQDNVLAIIGSIYSGLEASSRPITEREQVSQIMGHPTNAEMRAKKFKWSFNVSHNEVVAAAKMIDVAKSKGYKKVVAVAESALLYQTMLESLKTTGASQGIEVIPLADTMNIKDVDVTPQITKLKDLVAKEKPQALMLVVSQTSIGISKALKQLGVDLPVIGSHNLGNNVFLGQAGDAWNGWTVLGTKISAPDQLPDSDPQKAMILDFDKRYKAKFNSDHMGIWGPSYDATNIVANALKVGGADRAKIRDAIENTKNFTASQGNYTFSPDDHEGLNKDSLVVYEIKDKKLVLVK